MSWLRRSQQLIQKEPALWEREMSPGFAFSSHTLKGIDMEIRRYADAEELSGACAEFIALEAVQAIKNNGVFHLCLSGGGTPKRIFDLMASPPVNNKIPWENVQVYWGDERCVSPDHTDSNYNMAREHLLKKINIPAANIHRMPAETQPPEKAAELYEEELRAVWPENEFPAIDLNLLGVGPDGHTASLFPGVGGLDEQKKWVIPVYPPEYVTPRLARISLTLPALNASKLVVFLASGSGKRDILDKIFNNSEAFDQFPAARVKPERLIWFVDKAAHANRVRT